MSFQAGDMTGFLLAAPHVISPDWLRDGRDAVPFAAASPIAPVVAGRLAAATRAQGERLILCCPVVTGRSAEKPIAVPAEGTRIHAAVHAMGTPEALLALPDLSSALLATGAGFAVAAGARPFVEVVAGSDLRRARSLFAEFALRTRQPSVRPLRAAEYYGCALSGRPWRQAWLAWHRAADVRYGSGISGELAAMRRFTEGLIGAGEFGRIFRAARRQEMAAGERAVGPLARALDTVCWALDGYLTADDGRLWSPGHIDLDGLREAVTAALADI